MKTTKMKKKEIKKKGVKKARKFDPFQLDGTKYARLVKVSMNPYVGDAAAQDRATQADLKMTNAHPLRKDVAVQRVVEEVQRFEHDLHERRYPGGGCVSDAYKYSNEGWFLRPEVLAKIIWDYIRAHPELL